MGFTVAGTVDIQVFQYRFHGGMKRLYQLEDSACLSRRQLWYDLNGYSGPPQEDCPTADMWLQRGICVFCRYVSWSHDESTITKTQLNQQWIINPQQDEVAMFLRLEDELRDDAAAAIKVLQGARKQHVLVRVFCGSSNSEQ